MKAELKNMAYHSFECNRGLLLELPQRLEDHMELKAEGFKHCLQYF